MARRAGTWFAAMLLVACGGGAATTTNAPTTAPATTAPTTTTTTIPEVPITQETQNALVVQEDELPVDLRLLIPTGVSLEDGPEHFSTFRWRWVELPFVSYDAYWLRPPEEEPVLLRFASGTQLLDTVEKAENLFSEGVAATISDGGVEFEVPSFGDEATGLVTQTVQSGTERWDTVVIFRRGALLAHATLTTPDEPDDQDLVVSLAGIVADRIEAAATGDLDPVITTNTGYELLTAPPRQLGSYEFEMNVAVDLGGLMIDVTSVGEFQAPNLMWCEVTTFDQTLRLIARGRQLVLDLGQGWEEIDPDSEDAEGLLSMCPGHVFFFDNAFPLGEEDFIDYRWNGTAQVYASPEFTPDDAEGVETRSYNLDQLLAWADLVDDDAMVAGGGLLPDEIGELAEFEVSFSVAGGWTRRLHFSAELDPVLLFGPEIAGDDRVPMSISYTITNVNDASISIEFPEDLVET